MRFKQTLARVALLALLVAGRALAEPWRFAVMPDTQWSPADGHEGRGVAVEIIDAVNAELVRAKVSFVVAVGDLTNNASSGKPADLEELNIRAAHNRALEEAGIRFFPVRGNHDNGPAAAERFGQVFPNLPGTPGFRPAGAYADGSSPDLPGLAGLSYSFRHDNAVFVLLDTFAVAGADGKSRTYTIAEQLPWLTEQLRRARAAGRHAFVFSHKNLLGQNHKDNLFGNPADKDDPGDANPKLIPMQTEFYRVLSESGVRYVFSGHDHVYHRARVTSPAPGAEHAVEQIISGSCSHKFYDPRPPYSANELPLAQGRLEVGFLLVTVDGPQVTVDYYSTPTESEERTIKAFRAPERWTHSDRFGYSQNGRAVVVRAGESFAGITDTSSREAGFLGTVAALLAGENREVGSTLDSKPETRRPTGNLITTGWAPAPADACADRLTLWGLRIQPGSVRTNPYALALTYDPARAAGAEDRLRLLGRAADGRWVPAVELNTTGQPRFVDGPYQPDFGLGAHGVDRAARRVWAVLDHDGEFTVGRR